jgi:excisionase family DNA binding protein
MIYNVTQVAQLLGCTEEIVAERINSGDLPGVKFGRSWVIPADALRERLNQKALEEARERREPKRVQSKRREPPRLSNMPPGIWLDASQACPPDPQP